MLPTVVIAPPGGEEEQSLGAVQAPFAEGAVLLSDAEGRAHRLSWDAETASQGEDTRRALKPGRYVLRGWTSVRRDDAGVRWHVSAAGASLKEIAIEPGQTVDLGLQDQIVVRHRLKGRQIGVQVLAQGAGGITIYKDGKRIPLAYRLVGSDGVEVASGPIRYG